MEAVKTNVIGSDNVITACVNNGVKLFSLSTDKAGLSNQCDGYFQSINGEKNVIGRHGNYYQGTLYFV